MTLEGRVTQLEEQVKTINEALLRIATALETQHKINATTRQVLEQLPQKDTVHDLIQ